MVMRVSKLHVNPKQKTNLAAIAARCLPLHVYSKRDPVGREMKVKTHDRSSGSTSLGSTVEEVI